MNRRFTAADKKMQKKYKCSLFSTLGARMLFFTLLEFQALDFNFVGRRMFMCHLPLHCTQRHFTK